MCNVEDEDGKPCPRTEKSLTGSKCVKCDEPGVLITRIHDSFCKSCFQVYTVHKFRSAIGKSKLIRDGETVLVAFSGGANSAALLHLIQDGLSHRAHKRLRFTPTLLHVDESGLFGTTGAECKDRQEKIKQIMLKSGFPAYWTQLEQGLRVCRYDSKPNTEDSVGLPVDYESDSVLKLCQLDGEQAVSPPPLASPELTENLQNVIKNVGNTTALEDFVCNLRNQLLVLAARQLGFTKVFTAETSTRLGIRILSDVAQGRGAQVSLDTGISDERNKDIMFMRPVRDLNAKELAMYNSLFDVESVFTPTLTTKTGLASSIERLTETFVTGLQAEFPSTVSNIVRTSEKLGLPNMNGTENCSFCQSPLDTNVSKASALGAVIFSQQMSRGLHSGTHPAGAQSQSEGLGRDGAGKVNGCMSLDASCQEGEASLHSIDALSETVCYGCRLTLSAFNGDVQSLPALITKTASLKIREKQREQLSGFLLDDTADTNTTL